MVYVRNFVQSDKVKNISAKLCHQFIKARVIRPVGNVAFEIGDFKDENKSLGVYHMKDIKNS